MKEALHKFDGDLYILEAYCIMSNHVHILIDTSLQLQNLPPDFDEDAHEYQFVKDIMFRIKGSSARYINIARQKTGTTVWASESFDRYIRNDKHYLYTINYIINNPVKAGLVHSPDDWEGTYVRE